MKKHSLSTKGLSLSQAQSISNLCNQRAREIDGNLVGINNYSKEIIIPSQVDPLCIVTGNKLPSNIVDLLIEKAKLHATQAFLMENIKAKDTLLRLTKIEAADLSSLEEIVPPKSVPYDYISLVDENWGWEQLTVDEICKFQEAEAYAAHIGQFIHQDSTLDKLRKELPKINPVEWMSIKDGEKTPVRVKVHHTSDQLLTVHEKLANIHRDYEQTVNYYKAKVKNLTTLENARIAKINSDAQNEVQKINNEAYNAYDKARQEQGELIHVLQKEHEIKRQEKIKEIASLKIMVHPLFQETINLFLNQLTKE